MDPSRTAGIVALVLSIPQGLSASFQIVDRFNSKKLEVPMISSKRTWFLASLLFLGMVACIAFGCWILFADPFRPVTIEKTVTVDKVIEKTIPCPPEKTGSATTKGNRSPAITGSQNAVTYGTPAKGSPKQ
jgi:hypothetical protein